MHVGVSFAKTLVAETGAKAEALRALGCEEGERGDPPAISYSKKFPDGETHRAEEEARRVMGEHWVSGRRVP